MNIYKLKKQIREKVAEVLASVPNEKFDRKWRYFDDMGDRYGLNHSTWSIYEVEDLLSQHPYTDLKTMVYQVYIGTHSSGFKGVQYEREITGTRWLDLWIAADKLIKTSEDYHIFIECFAPEGMGRLELITGS